MVGLGIGLMFQFLGWKTYWYTASARRALTWTLPFGLLIMFAVNQPVQSRLEEEAAGTSARDASSFLWTIVLRPVSRHDRGRAVRVHAILRRISAHPGDVGRSTPCRLRSGT